jgi:Putative Ig domain
MLISKISGAAGRAFGFIAFAAIALVNVAHALTLSGQSSTAVVNQAYSFKPAVSGSSGQQLWWQVTNKPSWLSFNYYTGALTGTAPSAELNKSYTVTISARDGGVTALLNVYVKVVAPVSANTAPTISGTPSLTATVGTAYNFAPTAKDANGDALAYSITNKPTWATFSTATGALTGTPTAAGTFANIVISVSDGKVKTSLPAFAVNVVAPVKKYGVTLSWKAPTMNDDFSPLTDLAGYRVMYGTSANNMTTKLELPGATMTSVRVEELVSGTYFFAVKAVRKDGVESNLTETVWKTL